MNKLAAGALALALGLGAVAPAVAAEHTGAELVLERYEGELKAANEAYKKFLDAEEKLNVAEKELKEAEAERKAAEEAYNALFPSIHHVYDEDGKIITVADLELRPVIEAAETLNLISNNKVDAATDVEKYQSKGKEYVEAQIRGWVNNDAKVRPEQFESAINNYVDRVVEYSVQLKSRAKKLQAYQNLKAAEAKKTAKNTAYKEALAVYNSAKSAYEAALKVIADRAAQYGLVVQVGANGLQIVKPSDDKVKPAPGKKSKEELVKELKAAIEKNKVAIASAEFLLENAPKSVAKVKSKLVAQIANAKAIIEKSEKALAKLDGKMALVATAYADETTDELESLIKENEESADAINETIKENEAAQPDVDDDEEEEEEEKPEKPENKPARQAGTNARTGIAGVAGVAGILAAASVAYAASKRD